MYESVDLTLSVTFAIVDLHYGERVH